VPTTNCEPFSADIVVDDHHAKLSLWDIDGSKQGCAERARPLAYAGTDVFLVCFSLVDPASLDSVRSYWYPELRKYAPSTPIVLVGTKLDLRDDPTTIALLSERVYSSLRSPLGAAALLTRDALCRDPLLSLCSKACRQLASLVLSTTLSALP
jgi:GTPase SAR1 family protein